MSYKGQLNRYTCRHCERSVVTIDEDDGTTPFMIRCECRQYMSSAMYRDVKGEPTHAWRKPHPSTVKKLNASDRAHVSMGGLLLYPILKGAA